MTSRSFFNVLLSRAAELPKTSGAILSHETHPLDVVLEIWLRQAWEDFADDPVLMRMLLDFVNWRLEVSKSEAVRMLKDLILSKEVCTFCFIYLFALLIPVNSKLSMIA
jgi:hypothetical protein